MKTRRVSLLAILGAVVWLSGCVTAPPANVLMIGSSLTSGDYLPKQVIHSMSLDRRSARELDVTIKARWFATITILYGNKEFAEEIATGAYDFVVVEADPIYAGVENWETYTRLYIRDIREHGQEPVLFLVWRFDGGLALNDGFTFEDIREPVMRLADELDVLVAPVGIAFERVKTTAPEIELFLDEYGHANEKGTFLQALVIYTTLTGGDPRKLSYLAEDVWWEGAITPEEAEFFSQVAWDVHQELSGP